MPLIGPEDPPEVFMAKAAAAGIDGGTIMSLPPESFRPDPERSQHWQARLDIIFTPLNINVLECLLYRKVNKKAYQSNKLKQKIIFSFIFTYI